MIKLNLGSGCITYEGFINIDNISIKSGRGDELIDVIMDLEKDKLPYEDNSVDEIKADNILEHIGDGLIFLMNECHRVLKPEGIMTGNVPPANSEGAIRDITHKRQFVKGSFGYFCGQNDRFPAQPYRPKYANYGVKPWYCLRLTEDIQFVMRPRKTVEFDKEIIQDNLKWDTRK